jgi:hypothetical protein
MINRMQHIRTISLTLLLGTAFLLTIPAEGEDEAYANSLFLALRANNESLEDFDVVFFHRVSSVQPTGKSASIERVVRSVRSSERGIRLIASQDLLEGTTRDGDDIDQLRVYAAAITDEGNGTFVQSLGIGHFKNALVQSLKKARWPRFDLVGLVGFPGNGTPYKGGVSEFQRFIVPGQGLTSSIVGNIALIEQSRVNDSRETVSKQWKFDTQTQLPVGFMLRWENEDKSISLDHRKHRMEWKEYEGVSCPVRVEEDVLHNLKGGRYYTYRETDLKWLLVNEPIPDELTDIDLYSNQPAILEFLAPAREFKDEILVKAELSVKQD